MTLATKVAAPLTIVGRQDVEELSPAGRQGLAALCRQLAEPPPPPAKSGVLYDLKTGRRPE